MFHSLRHSVGDIFSSLWILYYKGFEGFWSELKDGKIGVYLMPTIRANTLGRITGWAMDTHIEGVR